MSNDAMIVTTSILANLNKDAKNRNRQIDPEWFAKHVDPDGFHLLAQALMHNEIEYRCQVYIKTKESMEPVMGWIDVSFENWDKVKEIDKHIRQAMADAEKAKTT